MPTPKQGSHVKSRPKSKGGTSTANQKSVTYPVTSSPTPAVVREHALRTPRFARLFWQSLISGKRSFGDLIALSAVERSDLIEQGVPAAIFSRLSDRMDVPKERLYKTLGVKRATVDRKIKDRADLTVEQSESVVGLARLIGQVEQVVSESGHEDSFDAARWVAKFLARPHPALGGRKPEDLMRTGDGRSAVATLVAQMQSGAYA